MKRALCTIIALVMALSLGITAYAAGGEGTITIKNPVKGQCYYVYRVFDLEGYDPDLDAYSYKLNEKWKDFANLDTVRGVYITQVEKSGSTYVEWVPGADVSEFADLAIKWAKSTETDFYDDGACLMTNTDTNIVFENLPLGYYLIDSSVGALCSLTTNAPDATVTEKNDLSTIEKMVKEDSTGKFGTENSAQLGDTVEFKSEITIGEGAEGLTVHDVMDSALVLDKKSFTIMIEETTVPEEKYTIKTEGLTDGDTFEISFDNEYVRTLKSGTAIQIGYKAVVGKDAVNDADGLENRTWIAFGDNLTSVESSTKTYTSTVEFFKTNEAKNVISGAEFYLYDSKTGGKIIPVVKVNENDGNGAYIYRIATDDDNVAVNEKDEKVGDVIKAGFAVIEGLDRDVYYLDEKTAPNGFNKLAERYMLDLRTGNLESNLDIKDYISGTVKAVGIDVTNEKGVTVVNKTGAELPTTGGIGTSMFYVTGAAVAALGFVLLVYRRRMAEV